MMGTEHHHTWTDTRLEGWEIRWYEGTHYLHLHNPDGTEVDVRSADWDKPQMEDAGEAAEEWFNDLVNGEE